MTLERIEWLVATPTLALTSLATQLVSAQETRLAFFALQAQIEAFLQPNLPLLSPSSSESIGYNQISISATLTHSLHTPREL
jgi:hypothetical protein